MAAYCETTDYYIPRDNELCLALYDDGWYRAICINRSYTHTTCAVFFVDFGNTEFVSHKDLRLMPKDFTTPDTLANICNIISTYILTIVYISIIIILLFNHYTVTIFLT